MKKIFKKALIICSALLALCVSVPGVSADTGEFPEYVEISFKVGDENLSINGNMVTVEKPYVTEGGTTLVPVRVITEAFGAKVLWDEETEKITIEYPDVIMVLQIGNKVARVNDHAEELSEAPVISDLSTMVPLRFISESFGATVGYDDETQSITVIKEAHGEESTLAGTTELPYIGDSYFGWIMDNPKNFIMGERSFNGDYTSFIDENGNSVDIEIIRLTEEMSFDEYFSIAKDELTGYTLVKADKCVDRNGNKYMHFQSKSYGMIVDTRSWIGEENMVAISTYFDEEADDRIKKECLSLADSFYMGGVFDEKVYNLTDTEDGYRVFEDEKYKFEFKIPADYLRSGYSAAENEFTFIKEEDAKISYVFVNVYSKSDTATAEKFAVQDKETNTKYINRDLVKATEIEECTVNGVVGYRYTCSPSEEHMLTDVFFEVGDYVYNLGMDIYSDENTDIADTIINSFTAEKLDMGEIGTILRNDPEKTDRNIKTDKWRLTMPYSWTADYDAFDTGAAFSNRYCNSVVTVGIAHQKDITDANKEEKLSEMAQEYADFADTEIVEETNSVKINGDTYYKTVMVYEDDTERIYITIYITHKNSRVVSFVLTQGEAAYNSAANEEFVDIIKSFEMK